MPRHKNKIAPNWIPTDAVRAHIAYLKEATSCSLASIARAADMPLSSLRTIVTRGTDVIHHTTSEAVLAVTPEIVAADATWYPVETVRQHLEKILAAEDCTHAALISASGFDPRDIRDILDGTRVRVRPGTHRAIMRLTPEIVRRNSYYVSDRRAKTRIWALRANDWTLVALAHRLGYKDNGIPFLTGKRSGIITQDLDRRIEAMFAEIGDRRGQFPTAGRHAAARGYFQPIHYDKNMNLIRDSVRGRGWTPLVTPEERARKRLRMLGLTLRDQSGPRIADALGENPKTVERARKMVGVRLESQPPKDLFDPPFVKPGQDDLVALIAKAVEPIVLQHAVDSYDTPGTDHVALWDALVAGAAEIHHSAAYVALWESLLAAEQPAQVAA